MLRAENIEGLCSIRIDGDMTIYTARELKEGLAGLLAPAASLELDLSGVSEMDTAGFQLVLMLWREAALEGKGFRVSAYSPAAASVVRLYNMEQQLGPLR